MTTTIETRTSVCEGCGDPIEISVVVGEQRWDDVEWKHVGETPGSLHPAVPELRFAIDATCPGCDYPEIGYSPRTEQYICSRCGHTQDTRPVDDEPDAPCCPDPECSGNPCTFPGYVPNN